MFLVAEPRKVSFGTLFLLFFDFIGSNKGFDGIEFIITAFSQLVLRDVTLLLIMPILSE